MSCRRIRIPRLRFLCLLTESPSTSSKFPQISALLHKSRPVPATRKPQQRLRLARSIHTRKTTRRETALLSEEAQTVDRLKHVLEDALEILQSPRPPDETAVLKALTTCKDLAKHFKEVAESSTPAETSEITPAQNLLSLEEKNGYTTSTSNSAAVMAAAMRENAVEKISAAAYSIITAPTIFITPKILEEYVKVQSLLERPETLSQVFTIYATKAIPLLDTSPLQYKPGNPKQMTSAVPLRIAKAALDAAIHAKNLPLCLDIINSSVCAPAFRRSKIMKNALLPISAITLTPLAAFAVASQLSDLQDTMSSEMATNVAFAGIFSYVAFTATIGFVAVTTANDQMKRMTWATGMPLRERWLREPERAMLDKVAGAWGFSQVSRQGEEEGYDWESLREFAGLRGMVLDRVSLMEGME